MAGIKTDCVGKKLDPVEMKWTRKDIILYNIGIGAYDLEYVYEQKVRAIPTFAVVAPFTSLMGSLKHTGANPMMILHGEQKIVIHKRPLPVDAETVTSGEITELWDKVKGALYRIKAETKTTDGEHLFDTYWGVFVRGAGGWGGEKGPEAGNIAPDRDPDHVIEDQTMEIQAKIYRLSGDINPLHVDPAFAQMAGFKQPILHGLCSYGFVGRAVIEACCGGDPDKLKEFDVRFRSPVMPGDKITTKIWNDGPGKCILTAEAGGKEVIQNAAAVFDV